MFNKKQARLAGLLLIAQAAVMVWFNIYQKLGFSWDLVIEVALVGATGLLILLGKPKFSFITMTIKAVYDYMTFAPASYAIGETTADQIALIGGYLQLAGWALMAVVVLLGYVFNMSLGGFGKLPGLLVLLYFLAREIQVGYYFLSAQKDQATFLAMTIIYALMTIPTVLAFLYMGRKRKTDKKAKTKDKGKSAKEIKENDEKINEKIDSLREESSNIELKLDDATPRE